jgi:hypothetical protein
MLEGHGIKRTALATADFHDDFNRLVREFLEADRAP